MILSIDHAKNHAKVKLICVKDKSQHVKVFTFKRRKHQLEKSSSIHDGAASTAAGVLDDNYISFASPASSECSSQQTHVIVGRCRCIHRAVNCKGRPISTTTKWPMRVLQSAQTSEKNQQTLHE
jgi:hypothetical protein